MSAADLLTRNGSGVFVGHCPPPAKGIEVHCAKAPAPNGSPYDFSLLITIVRSGATAEITQMVPVANGGLLIATRSATFAVTVRDRYVKKIVSESINGGVLGIRSDEVKEYYSHFVKAFFRIRTNIVRYDASHNLLEEKRDINDYAFPPLPAEQPKSAFQPEAAALALASFQDLPPVGRIWFPQVTTGEDEDDCDVEDGHIVIGKGAEPTHNSTGKLPGIYVDVLGSDEPPLSITIIKSVDAKGHEKPIAASRCVTTTVTSRWDFVSIKKKKSWFRKKTKIKRIRESLLVVTGDCAPLPL